MLIDHGIKSTIQAMLEHPTLHGKQCLNAKQGKRHCTNCVGVCPNHCIQDAQKEQAEFSNCENCGLCASVCPTHAIGWSRENSRVFSSMVMQEKKEPTLRCSMVSGAGERVTCLAAVPWEMLAAPTFRGSFTLLHGDCASCRFADKMYIFESALTRARTFLGEKQQMRICVKRQDTPDSVSRRQMFGSLFNRAKQVVYDPEMTEIGASGRLPRTLLLTAVRLYAKEEPCWEAPDIGNLCWACGVCTSVCPQNAIQLEKTDQGWKLTCLPRRCVSCGVCEAVCPEGAIQGTKTVHGPFSVQVQADRCEICGAPIKPGSGKHCMRCEAKAVNRPKKIVKY